VIPVYLADVLGIGAVQQVHLHGKALQSAAAVSGAENALAVVLGEYQTHVGTACLTHTGAVCINHHTFCHFVVAGDMTSKFTHLNDGCLVWIDPTDGIGENGTKYIKSYSTGMYIEVYNDMIVVRGRKFVSNSLYFGHAVYIIPTQDSDRQVVSAKIDGTLSIGNTVSADIGEENAENFTFNWIVDGKTVSTRQTWTIDKNEYAGKHVYLRAIDKDGYYVTAKSGYTVSTVTFGDNPENPICTQLVFDQASSENAIVLVAIYDQNKQLIGIKFAPYVTQSITVTADKSTGAKWAKAFVFDSLSSLKPLCESAEAVMA